MFFYHFSMFLPICMHVLIHTDRQTCDFYYKLNFTILACEMSATVWQLEHSLPWPLRDWNENWPFPDLWPLLSFPNLLAYWGITFTAPSFQFIQFSQSVMTDSLWPHEPQHARPPCPSPTPITQTHVHWVSDAIQPSHPLLSPSPPALNLSQHPGLF